MENINVKLIHTSTASTCEHHFGIYMGIRTWNLIDGIFSIFLTEKLMNFANFDFFRAFFVTKVFIKNKLLINSGFLYQYFFDFYHI